MIFIQFDLLDAKIWRNTKGVVFLWNTVYNYDKLIFKKDMHGYVTTVTHLGRVAHNKAAWWYPSLSVVVLSVYPLVTTLYILENGPLDRDAIWDVVGEVGPRNRVLDDGAHWRHLANTVERLCVAAMNRSATGSGDAACSQITLGNLVKFLEPQFCLWSGLI